MPDRFIHFKIDGMHCVMCARSCELALKSSRGVKNVSVNYATSDAILYVDETFDIDEAIKKIERLGYRVQLDIKDISSGMDKMNPVRFILGFAFSAISMILMHFYRINIFAAPSGIVFVLIASILTIFISYPIFIATYQNLKIPNLSMDVMYSLGIGVSFLSSIFGYIGLISDEFVMFDTSVMLGSFLMLGRFLEERSKIQAQSSIMKLMSLQPTKATLIIQEDGKETTREVDTRDIKKGDILLVRASERIPVDGVVIDGYSYVDTSPITGENLPRSVSTGDKVFGGSINLDGALKIECTATGDESLLSRIIRTSMEARNKRPAIERISDSLIKYFIPVVLFLSLTSFVYWYFAAKMSLSISLSFFISTIVVACPCALGLAVPSVVSVGIDKASELGILIKDASVFEKISQIDTVALDKTGTITEGKMYINQIVSTSGLTETELLRIACSIERYSTHPVAEAIVREGERQKIEPLKVSNTRVYSGRGISGEIDGRVYLVGNHRFIKENIPDFDKDLKEENTVVYIADRSSLYGYIRLSDEVRSETDDTIRWLRSKGYKVILLSGDRREAVGHLAGELSIDEFYYEQMPEDKAKRIEEIQKLGHRVLFVGDGINDAPALHISDLGIAIGKGTEIAIESGDVVLMNRDMRLLKVLFDLSEKVMKRIRLNLFWATFYNAIMVPFAMGLFFAVTGIIFKPEFSALAMVFSSISVMLISLSLKFYKPEIRHLKSIESSHLSF